MCDEEITEIASDAAKKVEEVKIECDRFIHSEDLWESVKALCIAIECQQLIINELSRRVQEGR